MSAAARHHEDRRNRRLGDAQVRHGLVGEEDPGSGGYGGGHTYRVAGGGAGILRAASHLSNLEQPRSSTAVCASSQGGDGAALSARRLERFASRGPLTRIGRLGGGLRSSPTCPHLANSLGLISIGRWSGGSRGRLSGAACRARLLLTAPSSPIWTGLGPYRGARRDAGPGRPPSWFGSPSRRYAVPHRGGRGVTTRCSASRRRRHVMCSVGVDRSPACVRSLCSSPGSTAEWGDSGSVSPMVPARGPDLFAAALLVPVLPCWASRGRGSAALCPRRPGSPAPMLSPSRTPRIARASQLMRHAGAYAPHS